MSDHTAQARREGAEDMRERAARYIEDEFIYDFEGLGVADALAKVIRALPLTSPNHWLVAWEKYVAKLSPRSNDGN